MLSFYGIVIIEEILIMKLTNGQIYNIALQLQEAFYDNKIFLPAKINFYLQKNKNLLLSSAMEIQQIKNEIMLNESLNNLEKQQQLDSLSEIEQDIPIKKIPISWIDNNIQFNILQMNSIMFMIDDEVEKENLSE